MSVLTRKRGLASALLAATIFSPLSSFAQYGPPPSSGSSGGANTAALQQSIATLQQQLTALSQQVTTLSSGSGNSGTITGTTFNGNGGTAGVPVFLVFDSATGAVSYVTATQYNALLAGGTIQTAPGAVSIALGTPASSTIPYTITPPTTGSAPITYQPYYRVTGTQNWTPAGSSSSNLTGTVTGLSPSTSYDIEVVAGNGAGTSTSPVVTASTTVAPPGTTASSAVLASNGTTLTLTFSQAVTVTPADFSPSAVAGGAVAASNTDAATSRPQRTSSPWRAQPIAGRPWRIRQRRPRPPRLRSRPLSPTPA